MGNQTKKPKMPDRYAHLTKQMLHKKVEDLTAMPDRYAHVTSEQLYRQVEELTKWTFVFKHKLGLWGQKYEAVRADLAGAAPRRMSLTDTGTDSGTQFGDSDGSSSPPPFP